MRSRIGHLCVHRHAGHIKRVADRGEQAARVVGALRHDQAAEGRRGYDGFAERAFAELFVAGLERIETCAGQRGRAADDPSSAAAPAECKGREPNRPRNRSIAVLGEGGLARRSGGVVGL